MSINELVILIIVGLVAGFLGGGLGIGGGIIIVPGLLFLLGFSQHQAQGTYLAVISFPIGFVAAMNYSKAGYVHWKYAAILITTFLLGSYLGSKLAIQLPAKDLRKGFGIFMFFVSLKIIFGK
jgi:uncharacterized membrane protein YfcA